MEAKRKPELESLSVSQARQHFSETLNRVYQDEVRVVVEKSGIPIAAIVPMSVARMDEEKEEHRRGLLEALKDAQEGFVGVSEVEAEREIAAALADIKRERHLARRIVSAIARVQPDLFEATDYQLEASIMSILQREGAKFAVAARGGADGES